MGATQSPSYSCRSLSLLLRIHPSIFMERSSRTRAAGIRTLRVLWDATTPSDAPCPFDAATVVVYAYVAVMTNEAAKAKLLAEYCDDGPGRGIVIGGLLQMLLDSAAVNDVLTINAKMIRDGETGGCLLS